MIAVVGSINLDVVVEVPRHPVPGETVIGGDRRVQVRRGPENRSLALEGSARAATQLLETLP